MVKVMFYTVAKADVNVSDICK